MTLSLYDEFAGAGGSTLGAALVPGVEPKQAANHNPEALLTHGVNFPTVNHILGDVLNMKITRFARADLFWASPACPPWTDARGKKRDFDKSTHQMLDGMPDDGSTPDEQTMRARKLMEEIPRYLRHWHTKGKPILAGVVENVVQCRKWAEWHRWLGEIQALGYTTRVIAFNSMHATPPRSPRAPQSRDRLYVAYWLSTMTAPDWDKWLRPAAWCEGCDETVDAIQVFKKPGVDMGRYGRHGQYVYKCPHHSCRGRVLHPEVLPALTAIDWALPGIRIGDRADLGMEPLADDTLARIRAGLRKFAVPAPQGGDGAVVPPLMVPVEGRPGKTASPATSPMRTQTARNETGVAWLPYIVPMRGGGDKERARPIAEPLHTVTAGGNHHGLVLPDPLVDVSAMITRQNTARGDSGYLSTSVHEPLRSITTAGHQSLTTWDQHLLVPYYSNGYARQVTEPVGTLTTRDRWAVVSDVVADADVRKIRFRMLEPHEIQAAMAFASDYIICGNSKRGRVRQLGNAVTPPVAELIVSALVEAITGEDLERAA